MPLIKRNEVAPINQQANTRRARKARVSASKNYKCDTSRSMTLLLYIVAVKMCLCFVVVLGHTSVRIKGGWRWSVPSSPRDRAARSQVAT